jgi:hypothetical protein
MYGDIVVVRVRVGVSSCIVREWGRGPIGNGPLQETASSLMRRHLVVEGLLVECEDGAPIASTQ